MAPKVSRSADFGGRALFSFRSLANPSRMIETLGDAHLAGWRLTIRCAFGKRAGMRSIPECKREVRVDMDTLIWTRGTKFPLASLDRYFKCPHRGSRQVRGSGTLPEVGRLFV
jgi:hypothetical protein